MRGYKYTAHFHMILVFVDVCFPARDFVLSRTNTYTSEYMNDFPRVANLEMVTFSTQ